MGGLELQEITVAGAAGTQVIEPFVCLGERHFARGDSFEKVRAWAANTVRIRILLEQTTVEHIEDALLVSLGISLGVQTGPPFGNSICFQLEHTSDCAPRRPFVLCPLRNRTMR